MMQKKILVLGASGMLGRTVFRYLSETGTYDVFGTTRSLNKDPGLRRFISNVSIIDATNFNEVQALIEDVRPDSVVNCIGIVKQRSEASDVVQSLELNSLFPQKLQMVCARLRCLLVHISTDCVFAGLTGNYSEASPKDALDLYGQSKALGEVHGPLTYTLRTSIIGRTPINKLGLLEWFLSQSGSVKGYSNAIFSGLTTLELSKVIRLVIESRATGGGIFNVSSSPISKLELLQLISEVFGHYVEIHPSDAIIINRSLDSSLFRSAFNYTPPNWRRMLTEYNSWISEVQHV